MVIKPSAYFMHFFFFGATPVLYIKCIDVAVKAQFIVRIEIVFKNIESKRKT